VATRCTDECRSENLNGNFKARSGIQNRLMNWGYAICDAALRAHVDAPLQEKLGIQITDTDKFPFRGGY
jgi:hypothetical protein